MKKKIMYISFWTHQLEDLVKFLKEKQYNEEELKRLQFFLKEYDGELVS